MCCPGGEGTSATGETIREGECTGWDLERDEERRRPAAFDRSEPRKVKVHNDKGQYVSVSVELPEYGGAWPIG